MTDAIKIACDFLSIESLAASSQLIHEFRKQRLVHRWPEDVLQFETSLWHAWNSLSCLSTITAYREQTYKSTDMTDIDGAPPGDTADLPSVGADTSRLLAKQESRQRKRHLRKQRIAVSERPRQKGHDCPCPYCPRFFNKSGLVFHL